MGIQEGVGTRETGSGAWKSVVADCPDSVPSSTETGRTNCLAPGRLSDSQVLQEPGDRSHWCVVAYWEEKTRVGRLSSVQEPSLDIFYDLPQGNGFCFRQLNSENKSQLVQKVRGKIGYGIQLTREVNGVWVYNCSSYPIFIKSATLDNPDSRMLLVHKVFPGFSIKAFDYEKAYSLQRPNDHEFMQQPWTGFTVQISFVKGWGQCYTRQFISSCPCWLEVILNNR
ncbi:mothers against decapentaplegic homolog 7-like [Geospiza fortis]|uniref:Mothers against decapentaplegic homolog 7-like n=1 Tax=Geospiza fortis TaxID=48883 RepID=A0A6I9HVC5_GEOFO|nr:mothers against decapentaplegic homolog 7-like [Geospiza fortis]